MGKLQNDREVPSTQGINEQKSETVDQISKLNNSAGKSRRGTQPPITST